MFLTACDGALVGSGYQGEPLFQIEGRIVDFTGAGPTLERPRASLFWSLSGETTSSPSELLAQDTVAVEVDFPAVFRFNIFERPDRAVLGDAPFLVGLLLIYDDVDADGVYDSEELRGGAFDDVILYTDQPLASADSPTRLPLRAGFSTAGLPLPCDGMPPSFSGEECGVPLGAECTGDEDCGEVGRCVRADGEVSFPGGYCVLPGEVECLPEGGALIALFDPVAEVDALVWGKGCQLPTDCREGYTCALDLAVCVPETPIAMFVERNLEFFPLCDDS